MKKVGWLGGFWDGFEMKKVFEWLLVWSFFMNPPNIS